MSNPISCIATGVQRSEFKRTSVLRDWRCGLTALSQTYNLYFVACTDSIHIYEPNFPEQSLSDEPALVLYPPKSRPDLIPAVINRLLVDYLGREEILLAVCDDGDVVGYRVSAIRRAVLAGRDDVSKNNEPPTVTTPRPFFHLNVGKSAWGLAVHREARMIAISANTHHITVVAFALTTAGDAVGDPSESDEAAFSYQRHQDMYIDLRAETNIPSVTFDNTGRDPTGKWLLSSSIDGTTHLWSLRAPIKMVRTFRMGRCVSVEDPHSRPRTCACPNVHSLPHAVWGALFLDPRSSRLGCKVDAFGVWPTEYAPYYWDVTKAEPRSNESFPAPDHTPDDSDGSMVSESDTQGEDPYMESADSSESSNPSENPDVDTVPEEDTLFVPEASISVIGSVIAGGVTVHPLPWEMLDGEDVDLAPISDDEESDLDVFDESTGNASWQPGGTRRYVERTPYCEIITEISYVPDAIFPPTLIITKSELYLLQPQVPGSTNHQTRIITASSPLYPTRDLKHPPYHDRYHLSAQIPELGIFVIGSQGGRCSIFSLTHTHEYDGDEKKLIYGFRQEYILPFDNQEKAVARRFGHGHWPSTKLVGIAVGPVQGMLDEMADDTGRENPDESIVGKRWRLLMLYEDHTLLSYDISRRREDDSLALDEMVV